MDNPRPAGWNFSRHCGIPLLRDNFKFPIWNRLLHSCNSAELSNQFLMIKFINTKNFAMDLLFPKFCLGCQREGSFLCEDCKTLLDISEFDYCLCDSRPIRLPPSQTLRQAQGKCSKCSDKKLAGLYFALSYKEKSLTRKLIHQFKYKPHIKNLSKTLAGILIEHFIKTGKNTDDIWENSVLIPVPLHKNKLKERGYNQSEELAKELAEILKIPVVSNSLIKIKSTPSQVELKKEEREKNLLNAFTIKNCAVSETAQFLMEKAPSRFFSRSSFLSST